MYHVYYSTFIFTQIFLYLSELFFFGTENPLYFCIDIFVFLSRGLCLHLDSWLDKVYDNLFTMDESEAKMKKMMMGLQVLLAGVLAHFRSSKVPVYPYPFVRSLVLRAEPVLPGQPAAGRNAPVQSDQLFRVLAECRVGLGGHRCAVPAWNWPRSADSKGLCRIQTFHLKPQTACMTVV